MINIYLSRNYCCSSEDSLRYRNPAVHLLNLDLFSPRLVTGATIKTKEAAIYALGSVVAAGPWGCSLLSNRQDLGMILLLFGEPGATWEPGRASFMGLLGYRTAPPFLTLLLGVKPSLDTQSCSPAVVWPRHSLWISQN